MERKIICTGEVNGKRTRWATWASDVQARPNGDLAIFDFFTRQGTMGFRSGAWNFRKRAGDYDIYDVDFGKRFQPRRSRKAH